MDKLSVRRGATLPITLTLDDDNALQAELVVKQSVEDVEPTFVITDDVVDGVANLTISSENSDIEPGVYLYQVTITYSNGYIEKYPETLYCDEDDDISGFPTLTIQESLD